jgi:hypothetical protein
MKRLALAVLLGVTLLVGLGCSITRGTDCGTLLSACSPIPPTTPADPAHGPWPTGDVFAVTGLVEDGQPLDLAEGMEATVTFRDPVELDVFTGCNTLHVSGDLSNDRIAPATVTFPSALPCPSRPSELGQWLSDFFQAGPTWSVDGDQLTLATDHATLLGQRQ